MKKTEVRAAKTVKEIISNCPYCGAEPLIEVEVSKKNTESDTISHRDVICYCCGLSAPVNVWESIADNFENPICEEGGEQ